MDEKKNKSMLNPLSCPLNYFLKKTKNLLWVGYTAMVEDYRLPKHLFWREVSSWVGGWDAEEISFLKRASTTNCRTWSELKMLLF